MKAFFSVESFFSFRYFLLYISLQLNFFYYIAKFCPNCHIFLNFILSFIMKYIHLVLSKYILYILISGKNMHKGLVFFIIEIFKVWFTKSKFIRYYYFINIYIIYWNRTFILMKFVFFNFSVITFYNFFYPFLYMVLIFLCF